MNIPSCIRLYINIEVVFSYLSLFYDKGHAGIGKPPMMHSTGVIILLFSVIKRISPTTFTSSRRDNRKTNNVINNSIGNFHFLLQIYTISPKHTSILMIFVVFSTDAIICCLPAAHVNVRK